MATGGSVGGATISVVVVGTPVGVRVVVRPVGVRVVVGVRVGRAGTVVSGTVVVTLAVGAAALVGVIVRHGDASAKLKLWMVGCSSEMIK